MGRMLSVPARVPMESPATVLLIGDAAAMRTALACTPTRHGYRVCTAATVPEAKAFLRGLRAAAIHLVIADVHLTPAPRAREGSVLYRRWRAAHQTDDVELVLERLEPDPEDMAEEEDMEAAQAEAYATDMEDEEDAGEEPGKARSTRKK